MATNTNERTSSNPMFNENRLRAAVANNRGGTLMTAKGAVDKTAVLLVLVFSSALAGWTFFPGVSWAFIGLFGIIAFMVAIVTAFAPKFSPITAPLYAIVEGLLLGGISQIFEASYPGIAFQAILGTVGVFFLMMILYRTGVVKVTARFRSVMVSAIMGVMFIYLISFVLSFFMPTLPLFSGGVIAIVFSIVVITVAAFSLMLDFDMIERSETFGAPKYMEWYCAFSLLVTLVWLYFEILRLLSYFRNR